MCIFDTRVTLAHAGNSRLAIKQMLERGNSKKEIAESIGVHTSTIYREIDRGTVNGHYDPTAAEEAYQEKLAEKGRQQFWKKIRNWRIISQN